ncbi:transposase, partial [Gordonia oryzae]
MGSTRRSFTAEYKAEAVRLVLDSGDSVASVAKNLGVHETTLGKWVKKARDEGGEQERPLDVDERAELERLRKENAHIQMQLEFARKVGSPDVLVGGLRPGQRRAGAAAGEFG